MGTSKSMSVSCARHFERSRVQLATCSSVETRMYPTALAAALAR